MRIATEEAFVTAEIMGAWRKVLNSADAEPGFIKMGSTILGNSPGTNLLHSRLLDLGEARIAQMDADGISMQVVSLTAPGVQVFDPDLAITLAMHANNALGRATREYPLRLVGLAAIAPNNPRESVREMRRAKEELGLSGVIVNSHTKGRYLDEPFFFPILEAASELEMPIYLHPREPGPPLIAPFLDYGLYFAGWGFAAECGLHAMRLIMSGLFDRLPRLRIVLGHLGEGIPFWLDRIDNRYELQVRLGAVKRLGRRPSEYFLDHFVITTSGMSSPAPLRLAIDTVGAERIMFAADYPYENAREAVDFFDTAAMTAEQRSAMYWRNAANVFAIADATE